MEEKRNSRGIIRLTLILFVLVGILIGYIIYDKILKDNIEIDKTKDTTSTQKTNKVSEDNVLKRDNFKRKIDGNDYYISYVYKLMDYKDFELWKNNSKNIDIKNSNEIYNMIYLEILLNEKKLDIEIPLYYNYEKSNGEELLKNITELSSDTINILKGNDSKYFIFAIRHANPYFVDGGTNPIIVSEEGKVIHTVEFQDNTGWWITDESSIMYDKGEYYLTNDVLYYLMPNCEKTNEKDLYFDEFSLKIKNDRVIIEKRSTYKGEAAGGAVCGG